MALANPSFSAKRMYETWPEERALAWVRAAPKHSKISFASKVTHTAYRDIPSSYIFCERDQILTPTLQKEYIQNIETISGNAVDVHKLDDNHVPNLTSPENLAEVIIKIAAAL